MQASLKENAILFAITFLKASMTDQLFIGDQKTESQIMKILYKNWTEVM